MTRNQMILAVLVLVALVYGVMNVRREGMVNKTCPDGTRTDGPCLLEFPGF